MNKKNIHISPMAERKTHNYRDPDRFEIGESDLRLWLREYAEAVRKAVTPFDLLLIISVWAPIFVSDFRNVADFSGGEVRGAYIAVVVIGSFYWLVHGTTSLLGWILKIPIHPSWNWCNWIERWRRDWLEKYERDPDRKVFSLRKKCYCVECKNMKND